MKDGKTKVMVDRLGEVTGSMGGQARISMTSSCDLFEFTFPAGIGKCSGQKIVLRDLTEGEVRSFLRSTGSGGVEDLTESIEGQLELAKASIYAYGATREAAAKSDPLSVIEREAVWAEKLSHKGRQLLSLWVGKQIWPEKSEADEFFRSQR